MKSLVIGGTGFVGGYLVKLLVQEYEHDVIVTKVSESEQNIEGAQSEKVSYTTLDILNLDSIKELLARERPDYIFHLAAQSSVKVSWEKPTLTVDVNIKGTLNVLEAVKCLDYKPKVLLIGSGEEYGRVAEEQMPIKESTTPCPENIYAVTKLCQNHLGRLYADAYGLNIVMVRAFNHIGPNQLPVFAVADFCKQVAEIEAGLKEPVILVGNLSASRDFTDVRDVVRAYCMLIEKGQPGDTYNVGSGKSFSLDRILQLILKHSAVNIEVEVDSKKLRPVDVPIIEANVSKLEAVTGWTPQIQLEQTICETLEYWRNKIKTRGI